MRICGRIAVVGLMMLGGCETDDPGDCVCTEEFATVGVYVVDANGLPADSVRTTVTVLRTGDTLQVSEFPFMDGYHVVADDRLTQTLARDGEWMRLQAEKGTFHLEQDFLIGTDPCRCHVYKWSGPDTLWLGR